jgi:hypothetical protein
MEVVLSEAGRWGMHRRLPKRLRKAQESAADRASPDPESVEGWAAEKEAEPVSGLPEYG